MLHQHSPGRKAVLVCASPTSLLPPCCAVLCACRLAVFRCECCGAEANEVVNNSIIAVPPQCPSATCGRKQTLRIIPNRCAYANRQVRLWEGVRGGHPRGGGDTWLCCCWASEWGV